MSVKVWLWGHDKPIDLLAASLVDPTDNDKLEKFTSACRVTSRFAIKREFVAPGLYKVRPGTVIIVQFEYHVPGNSPGYWAQSVNAEGRSIKRLRQDLLDMLAGRLKPTDPWGESADEMKKRFGLRDGNPFPYPEDPDEL